MFVLVVSCRVEASRIESRWLVPTLAVALEVASGSRFFAVDVGLMLC